MSPFLLACEKGYVELVELMFGYKRAVDINNVRESVILLHLFTTFVIIFILFFTDSGVSFAFGLPPQPSKCVVISTGAI
jgi:hypothetical protein